MARLFLDNEEFDQMKNKIISFRPLNSEKTFESCSAEQAALYRSKRDTFSKFGLEFKLNTGDIIECQSKWYQMYQMFKKPDDMTLAHYYIYMINPYAEGKTPEDYTRDLHCDMMDYLFYFPEHTEKLKVISKQFHSYMTSRKITLNEVLRKNTLALSSRIRCNSF